MHNTHTHTHTHTRALQFPLDSKEKIDVTKIESAVLPEKDVDGFHVLNTGHLFKKGDAIPDLIPCTPKGMMHMLKTEGVEISGKHCVVLGRFV
jgi:5,10-methylene-tetrahydrofolate dehydrogenase/methenyl tetrahydrofolate cyclohydrolase